VTCGTFVALLLPWSDHETGLETAWTSGAKDLLVPCRG
jgi:hypothetical protein